MNKFNVFSGIRHILVAGVIVSALGLGACSVHKIDVQQGNVITQEMLEKLSIGMEMKKVSGLLGTPLIEDPFHKGRWDYVYKFTAGDTSEVHSSHVTLYFDGNSLSRIDVRKTPPTEAEAKKQILTNR